MHKAIWFAAFAALTAVFVLADVDDRLTPPVLQFAPPAQAQTPSMRRRAIKPNSTRRLKSRLKQKDTSSAPAKKTTSKPAAPRSTAKPAKRTYKRPRIVIVNNPPPPPKPLAPKIAVADSDLLPPALRDEISRAPTREFEPVEDAASRFRPRQVLVGIAGPAPQALVDGIAQQYSLTPLDRVYVDMADTDVLRYAIPDDRPVADVLAALQGDARIVTLGPNHLFAIQADGKTVTGQDAQMSLQYALGKLRVPVAHERATGETIKIAVIDTRVDANHPELEGASVRLYNAAEDDNTEPDAHGTAITGIIATQKTLRGVAPKAEILAVQAFTPADSSGAGEADTMSILRGIDWADENGARVFNMSFAGPKDDVLGRMLDAAHDKGIIMVAASGNAGPDAPPLYPAAHDRVIAVTATDWTDKLYRRANQGDYITLAAPGVDILVAVPGGKFAMMSGTSLATAHISGMIALLLQHNPDLKPEDIQALITRTAVDLGPEGRDPQFGAGLADAVNALEADAKVGE